MRNVFGVNLRGGSAALMLRGSNGRSIRQHLSGNHNHLRKKISTGGGALSISNTVKGLSKKVVNVAGKTYIPLKFRI